MKELIDNLKGLGGRRLGVLGAAGLAVIGAVFLGMSTIFAPVYTPLYSELSPMSASRMVQSLEQSGIPVRLSRNGDVISVPEGDVARARMAVADGGLPSEGVPGWELFDDMSGMGMNSFMQRVNKLRALEGELARSIQTIDGIEAARVHLVLPEREAFSRDRARPSASVIVRSEANVSLSRRQGQAIQALVASAVADLETRAITVLSATGETIAAEEDAGGSDLSLTSQRAEIETRLADNVEAILNARVGPGNARVRVSVDLTNAREVRRTTSFDPSQQVARSIETRSNSSNETDPARGTVDAGNNIPDALADDGDGSGQGTRRSDTNDEIVNYEIGSVQSETIREPGDIERITVAVLVNGSYQDANGDPVFVERSPEELAQLERLVRTAIGFDEERGDEVQIESLQFQGYDGDLSQPVGGGISGFLSENAITLLRAVFGLAAIALVLVFGRQPLKLVLDAALPALPAPQLAGMPVGVTAETTNQLSAPHSAPGQGRLPAPSPNSAHPAIGVPESEILATDDPRGSHLVQLSSVEGGVERSQLRTVSALAERHPEEALRVLNSWLTER